MREKTMDVEQRNLRDSLGSDRHGDPSRGKVSAV